MSRSRFTPMVRLALLLLMLTTVLPAQAAPVATSAQGADDVSAAMQSAKAAWPTAKIIAPEHRVACATPAIADAPTAARNGVAQIRVRCLGNPGWTRFVALQVEQEALVAVLRTPLARGQALSASQIEWQSRDALRLPADVLNQATALNNVSARRDLAAGTVLLQSQLVAPKTIARGQSVMLVSRAPGMEIRAPGEALADAALGTRVRVRNSASRRIVEGIAQADGTVEVML